MYDLIKLGERLRRQITNSAVSLSFNNQVLNLTLDKKNGFEGFEDVYAEHIGESYKVKYWALALSAFDTFLNNQNTRQISESELLTKLKDKIARLRTNETFVRHEKGEQYTQIVDIEEVDSLDEVDKAFEFFLRAFNRK